MAAQAESTPLARPISAKDPRERTAFHMGGRALMLCLLVRSESLREQILLEVRMDGPLLWGRSPCGDRLLDDPWKNALLCCAGVAAEEVGCGCSDGLSPEERRRVEELLTPVAMADLVEDAFQATKDLILHHRSSLDALAEALLARRRLDGAEIWALFEGTTRDDPRTEAFEAWSKDR